MNATNLLVLGGVAVGGYFLYESFLAPAAVAAAPAATPAPGATITTPPPAATTPAPAANSSAVCSGTLAAVAASGDPNFTPSGADFLGQPYHWQVYWNLQPGAPALNIGAMYPDATVEITGAAFCAAAQAYLTAQGLSGYWHAGMGDDSDSSANLPMIIGIAAAGLFLAFASYRGSSKTRGQY
jgi:hypothetical protein